MALLGKISDTLLPTSNICLCCQFMPTLGIATRSAQPDKKLCLAKPQLLTLETTLETLYGFAAAVDENWSSGVRACASE